jgi:tetratricopeptide (TPR) repeat protein
VSSLEEPDTAHLTIEEIAGLIGRADPEGMSMGRARHARSCDICRRVIAMHQEEDWRLQQLAGGPREGPGDACPPATEWASLAAGLVDAGRARVLLAHASQCDACGAVLHAVVADFSDDMNDAESKALEALESSKPEWQRNVARRMGEASRRGRPIPINVRGWLAKAAAVIVAAGAGWLGWDHWMAPGPERLIAQAYTQQRPFEYRIPGAGHAAVRQEKRSVGSFQRPPALLEAEGEIARELETRPDSVYWLALRARAEMLGWESEAAIVTLQRALEQKPDDPGLLADLGVAYALRAEAQHRDVDYGYAIENLSRSLKAKPNSPEALFNRAVVYERMYLYDEAAKEWRRYLELDTAGAWSQEAQRRLAGLEQKKKSGRQP